MQIPLSFNRNFGKRFANDVMAAIKNFGLFDNGEKVCVALSGGKDSTTLVYILAYLNKFSPVKCELHAAHVKTDSYDTNILKEFCDSLGAAYLEAELEQKAVSRVKNHCYLCGRLKRGALAKLCAENGIRTLAFGHHADDAAETFLMNLFERGRLGSFCPKVEVGPDTPVLIRPMIYLEEATVRRIHAHAKLPLLDYACPFAPHDLRAEYKKHLSTIQKEIGMSGLAKKIVRALEHGEEMDRWEKKKKVVSPSTGSGTKGSGQ